LRKVVGVLVFFFSAASMRHKLILVLVIENKKLFCTQINK
jgi:hypothetical protein